MLGPGFHEIADLLEKVSNGAKRDNLFDVVITVTVSHRPNNTRIQDEIAKALGLTFDDAKDVAKRSVWLRMAKAFCLKFGDEKDVAERAKKLRARILMEQKVLVMLGPLQGS